MNIVTRRRIRLGAAALVSAAVVGGVVIGVASADPIGTQSRISAQGPADGNADFDAIDPAAAYDASRDRYLVVWSGDTAISDEQEIYGRFVSAAGAPVGGVFRISTQGPEGDVNYDATRPRVAYNATADEFMVVWQGDASISVGPLETEKEIFGQRVKGDGTLTAPEMRLTTQGTDGDPDSDAYTPDLAWSPQINQYLVTWHGDTTDAPLVDDEFEIYAQRFDVAGAPQGVVERISDMGGDANADYDGYFSSVVYNPDTQQWLVGWVGDDNADGQVSDEYEVFVQRLGQAGGALGGDIRVSELAGLGNADYDAGSVSTITETGNPSIGLAYNPVSKNYLVAFAGDDNTAPLVDNKSEIWAQVLSADTTKVGGRLRISTTGADNDTARAAQFPRASSSTTANEFLVSWMADDPASNLADNKFEIFAQRTTGAGVEVGLDDVQVSTTGAADNAAAQAMRLGLAHNATANNYLVSWYADTAAAPLVDNEFEVYSRLHGAGTSSEPFPANCKDVASRGTPEEVKVPNRITAAFLRTDQRTGAAAIRRANAIEKWLNDGIIEKDLCGGTLASTDLDANTTATSGPLGPQPPKASPRKIEIPKPTNPAAKFRANAIQMCINQRIYQTGIAKASALKARLAGQLTGGDVKDGTLTKGQLRQDLTITASIPNPAPPAASKTDFTAPKRVGCQAVKFTTKQAAINRRIAIQSVVRINEVRDLLAGGLKSENFKDGTITKVDFAPGVTP